MARAQGKSSTGERGSWVVEADAGGGKGVGAYLVLVDGRVGKAPLVGPLVEDHGVFHVVARVRDHGHHSVSALRVLVHFELSVPTGLNQRGLRGLDFVHLVVRSLVQAVHGRAHGLLAHLALVHDSGPLVVIAEGRERGDER